MAVALAGLLAACGADGKRYNTNPKKAFRTASNYIGEPYEAAGRTTPDLLSVGRIDLGRKLFFDTRLSARGDFSCASCHDPEQAFTQNHRAMPLGASSVTGGRNAPSLYDIAARTSFFRDGRASSLQEQVLSPLTNPNEMGNAKMQDLVTRLSGLDDYDRFFAYAFGAPANEEAIATALTAYQMTLITGPSRFDLWKYKAKRNKLSDAEVRGYALFTGKAGCSACHMIGERSAALTDEAFHDTGYTATKRNASADLGRFNVSQNPEDRFAFRTPSLRNVALTSPYMHDGGLRTLDEVVAFFDQAGALGLTAAEQADIVAFLNALTSRRRP